jgi:tetratricopeptide (TPR) repeat protein
VNEDAAVPHGEPDPGKGRFEAAHRAVYQLCCDYSNTPPAALVPRAQRVQRRLESLLGGGLEPSLRRRLLVDAGWLQMLLTCLRNDVGSRDAAWASREAALALGRETGELHLVAWAFETPSWFALYDGRPRQALDYALAGLEVAPEGSSGWLMLRLKAASAWARLGNAAETERHLEAASRALDELPAPEAPQHHFVFDPPKLHSIAATAYTWLGLPGRAEHHARSVIRAQADPGTLSHNPTRVAMGRLDLAQSLVEQGRLDEALAEAAQAFDAFPRRDTVVRAAELVRRLRERYPGLPELRHLNELHVHAARTLAEGRT